LEGQINAERAKIMTVNELIWSVRDKLRLKTHVYRVEDMTCEVITTKEQED
jgi:hypothetical protein